MLSHLVTEISDGSSSCSGGGGGSLPLGRRRESGLTSLVLPRFPTVTRAFLASEKTFWPGGGSSDSRLEAGEGFTLEPFEEAEKSWVPRPPRR